MGAIKKIILKYAIQIEENAFKQVSWKIKILSGLHKRKLGCRVIDFLLKTISVKRTYALSDRRFLLKLKHMLKPLKIVRAQLPCLKLLAMHMGQKY